MRTTHRSKRTKIENDSRLTSKTRRCIIDEDSVPPDLVFEILKRLPVKPIARFLLVSKLWSTIIKSQEFIRSYLIHSPYRSSSSSLHQPHWLFAFKDSNNKKKQTIWNFYSSSSSTSMNEPVSYLSSTASCSNISSPYVNEFPHYVNGLISLGSGREQIICNPSTGKSITLPKVKSRNVIITSFFGYDPVNGQYKVLSVSEKAYSWQAQSFKHEVFTLGVDKSWRMIKCNTTLHDGPETNGVCINGVVYYGIQRKTWCLVRFDVRSEKFDDKLVNFLGDSSSSLSNDPTLISYKGKVALAIEVKQGGFHLWVLEDAEKHIWSKFQFIINHRLAKSSSHLRIIGDKGGIAFVSHNEEGFYVVHYDQENECFRVNKIRGNSNNGFTQFSVMVPYSNYVESVMLL